MKKEVFLRLLLEYDAFKIHRPLPTRDFLKEARNQGISLNAELLEEFERRRLFFPLFRARFRIEYRKLQRRDDGSWEYCGFLEEGEEWSGKLEKKYVWPHLQVHDLTAWVDTGHLYSLEDRNFEPWDSLSIKGSAPGTNYYSTFQLYDLQELLISTSLIDNHVFLADLPDDALFDRTKNYRQRAQQTLKRLTSENQDHVGCAEIAQLLASRYLPSAQGDFRSITVQDDGIWDWHTYRHKWDATAVLSALEQSAEVIADYYKRLDRKLFWQDPLYEWDGSPSPSVGK